MAGARDIGPDTALRLPVATLRELHVGPSNRLPGDLASTLPQLRLHIMDVFSNAGLQVPSRTLNPILMNPGCILSFVLMTRSQQTPTGPCSPRSASLFAPHRSQCCL